MQLPDFVLNHADDSKVQYHVYGPYSEVEHMNIDGLLGHADVPLRLDGSVLKDAAAYVCDAGCHDEEHHDARKHNELLVD